MQRDFGKKQSNQDHHGAQAGGGGSRRGSCVDVRMILQHRNHITDPIREIPDIIAHWTFNYHTWYFLLVYLRWADEFDRVCEAHNQPFLAFWLKLKQNDNKQNQTMQQKQFYMWKVNLFHVDCRVTMLFHSPLASSSCPLIVKWKQSGLKKLKSILPFFNKEKTKSGEVDRS